MIMTHTPMRRPAITSSANPSGNAMTPQSGTAAPQADNQIERREFRDRWRGDHRGWYGRRHYGSFGMMPRSPMFGLVVIIGALLRGLIGLLIVRVLAEMGLAILGMPQTFDRLKILAHKQIVGCKAVALINRGGFAVSSQSANDQNGHAAPA